MLTTRHFSFSWVLWLINNNGPCCCIGPVFMWLFFPPSLFKSLVFQYESTEKQPEHPVLIANMSDTGCRLLVSGCRSPSSATCWKSESAVWLGGVGSFTGCSLRKKTDLDWFVFNLSNVIRLTGVNSKADITYVKGVLSPTATTNARGAGRASSFEAQSHWPYGKAPQASSSPVRLWFLFQYETRGEREK